MGNVQNLGAQFQANHSAYLHRVSLNLQLLDILRNAIVRAPDLDLQAQLKGEQYGRVQGLPSWRGSIMCMIAWKFLFSALEYSHANPPPQLKLCNE